MTKVAKFIGVDDRDRARLRFEYDQEKPSQAEQAKAPIQFSLYGVKRAPVYACRIEIEEVR